MVSLLLTVVFAGVSLSGAALFLAPSGRVAREVSWSFLAFSKDQWISVHLTLAAVFLILGLIHLLAFNARALLAHLRPGRRFYSPGGLRLELMAAIAAGILLVGAAAWLQGPGAWLAGQRAEIRESHRAEASFELGPQQQRGGDRGRERAPFRAID